MDEKKITLPLEVWRRCRDKMSMAAELYAVAVPLIDGTEAGREVAKLGLDKMAELLQAVNQDLFL